MSLPGTLHPPLVVVVMNLYDTLDKGRDARDVRSILVRDAEGDFRVLWLELPSGVIERLGLSADPTEMNRLSVVRLTIRDCTCVVPPSRGISETVVVGSLTLNALGLKLSTDGQLIDDPHTRWGPRLDGS